MRPALAAHPGKSQGPPPSKHGLEVHRPKRRARLRSPLQESPVPGDPLVRRRTGKSCRVKIFMPRVAAAPELGTTRRPLREAKRQPLTENCDVAVRGTACPMHGHVRARSRSTAQQTATTAVGLELGSDDGLDGTIGFDGNQSRPAGHRDYRFDQRRARGSGDRNATAGPVAAGCRFHAERSPDPGRPGVHRPTPDPCRARSPGARSRSRTTGSPRMSRQPQLLSAWRSARRSGNRLLRALGGRCAVPDRARPEDQADRCRVVLTASGVANASVQGLAARTRRWAGSKSNDAGSKPAASFSSA